MEPYRLIAYRKAAIVSPTGFQISWWPGSVVHLDVGPITWAMPSDG